MRVLAFGVFDVLHKGHEYFLQSAASLGELHVVIANSIASEALKGRTPILSHEERKRAVETLPYVAQAYIGDKHPGAWTVLQNLRPDIITIGYDQQHLEEHLYDFIRNVPGYHPKFVHLDSFKPEVYKSSIRNSYDR
ncbi:MAG: adenylyltransferase/cytidyltransferase family protein [bacterium]|nr:adenylyltransferase/cytidyltransferase family protein [bacterium]